MVNVILEPRLVLPIFVPNISQKKSGNERLTDIAKIQPHAAYSAFTHDINIVNIPTF